MMQSTSTLSTSCNNKIQSCKFWKNILRCNNFFFHWERGELLLATKTILEVWKNSRGNPIKWLLKCDMLLYIIFSSKFSAHCPPLPLSTLLLYLTTVNCVCWLHCELLAGMEQTDLDLVPHYQCLSICWNAVRSGTKSHLYTISQNSLSLRKTVPRFISSKARGSACLPTGSRRWIFSDLKNYRGHHHTTLKYSRRSTSWTSRDLEANTSPIQDTNKMSLCHLVILWLPSYSLYALGQTP